MRKEYKQESDILTGEVLILRAELELLGEKALKKKIEENKEKEGSEDKFEDAPEEKKAIEKKEDKLKEVG